MSPELKFHSIVISLTTLIIFSIWTQFPAQITQYPWLSVIASGIISIGLYRFIASTFLALFRKLQFVKKFILGPSYLEGLWIGFFVGHNNEIRHIVETFEQDLNELVIRGKVFRSDGTYHCSYVSKDATFDTKNGKLTYSYDADTLNNTHINPGLARFEVDRDSKEASPTRLTGYSSDLFHSKKLLAFEEKVLDKKYKETINAFKKSVDIFNKYKDHSGIGTLDSKHATDTLEK